MRFTEKMEADAGQRPMKDSIQMKFNESNKAQFTSDTEIVAYRNILLLGRVKSGKTTLVNMIRDPTRGSNESSARLKPIHYEWEQQGLPLKIIEADGLCDNGDDVSDKLEKIYGYATGLSIEHFHLICYCMTIASGIQPADIRVLRKIIDTCDEQMTSNLCVIITRYEWVADTERRRMHRELKTDSQFEGIVKKLGQGIYFSGSLNHTDGNVDCEGEPFQTVYQFRKKLIQLFQTNIEPFGTQLLLQSAMRARSDPEIPIDPWYSVDHRPRSSDPTRNRYVWIMSMYFDTRLCVFSIS